MSFPGTNVVSALKEQIEARPELMNFFTNVRDKYYPDGSSKQWQKSV
jgi:hypothetical protein